MIGLSGAQVRYGTYLSHLSLVLGISDRGASLGFLIPGGKASEKNV